MQSTLVNIIKTPFLLLALILSGCVFTDSPMLSLDDADPIPLRDGYYNFDSKAVYVKVQGGRVAIVNDPYDLSAQEVIVKSVGNGIYLMQSGVMIKQERKYSLIRFARDGLSADISTPVCSKQEFFTVFYQAGMMPEGTGDNCRLRNVTPAKLFRAYSTIAARGLPAEAWNYHVVPMGKEAALKSFASHLDTARRGRYIDAHPAQR